MKTTRFLVSLLLLGFSLSFAIPAYSLTDEQVVNYIKTQMAAGKSEKQIGQELLAKGVTPEQVKRIKAKYEQDQQQDGTSATTGSKTTTGRDRMRSNDNTKTTQRKSQTAAKNQKNQKSQQGQKKNNSGLNVGMSDDDLDMTVFDYVQEDIVYDENGNPITDWQFPDENDGKVIYGHELFNSENLTFEPNPNIATPANYRLGPGDEVIIDLWGANEEHIRDVLSPEGSIMIEQLGPVYLNGMTVKEAQKHVKKVFSRKYAGLDTNESSIDLTLGNVRSIQVDIMGEVSTPGTFQLSPFSSVFHALYNAGGINDIGSMRNIQVLRNGKRVADVDIYDYLFKGKQTGNIRLQEGDVIIVPPYSRLINVEGNVKRPMYYEVKPGETLATLLEYAGGFTGDAYSGMVRLQRQNGLENELVTVEKSQFPTYSLRDGDIVTVGTVIDRYTNRVELSGAVNRPGQYALGEEINTLRDLITKAEGLAEEAYLDRALIYREKPDRSMEIIAVNIGDVMSGRAADIALQKNDIIEVADVIELTERGDVTVNGQVAYPGQYPYADGMTVEDLVVRAGGLLEGASTSKVEVARRIVDRDATKSSNQIAEVFSFALENGLAVGDGKGFELKPYDIVEIRKSPVYEAQQQVSIRGQVLFDGDYTLQSKNERLSELVKRAGGVLESAYVKGASLSRKRTEDEMKMQEETLRLAKQSQNPGDSINLEKIDLKERYNVGIDLEKAIANPGSTVDLVLMPGDEIFVPEQQSTVKISGEVFFPNTVAYTEGKKLGYYIDQAGGYSEMAKKNKVYVVYLNGSVAKAKRNTPIEPGCNIIVPSKPEGKGFDWTKALSITSMLGSLATVAVALTTALK